MLGELDFYLPKSFCSTNVYGEYTEGKNLIVGLVRTEGEGGGQKSRKNCVRTKPTIDFFPSVYSP